MKKLRLFGLFLILFLVGMFKVSADGISKITMDIYVEGENTNSSNNTDIFDGGAIKALDSINNSDLSLKETANPILVLLFAIIFIPFIRIKY